MVMQMKKNTEHNLNWPYIPDHPYGTLIIEKAQEKAQESERDVKKNEQF